MRRSLLLPAVFVLFTVSGFAGLIYESIWSHYLKLFLGHAAYAQTLVLAIFMGGMALGAWGASRVSARLRDLLAAYALIEALIGLASLAFHSVFVAATAFAFERVIPTLGSPAAVHAFKWTLAAALILPQSVLLGMTFPFMTGGVLRLRPERSGYAVAMLYFTNSLGAGLGVLASGFYFIGAAGLPGTLTIAGVLNLLVAGAVMLLPRARAAAAPPPAPAAGRPVPAGRLLLAVAALTGLSSFMYEIGWIRMLSLVLGSTTHAFELMLSAFILGIAFGGLWVRRRIDAAGDTVRLLGWVQIAMGLAALATLPVYLSSFGFMQFALQALARNEGGYLAFNIASHVICLAVMFPAAFFAGMTLPLITASLLRRGAGERAIGQVYAANTAGSIAGVLVAVHLGFLLLGLKGLIVAGAAIDLALGLVLLGAGRRTALAAAGSAAALLIAMFAVRLDPLHLASGVYRSNVLLRPGGGEEVLLHIDGKTASVSVTASKELVALRTNGKSEGAASLAGLPPTNDEITMTLSGALPLFLAPEAQRIANIGFGTGITTHVVLGSDRVAAVDTIEIEPAVATAAARFRHVNARAFDDPRSRLHFEDAKTYFSARQERYDVIVSEPSNPWVSGVASLFSTEFYRDVRRYLRDGGLFVQWVNVYELSPQLLATIVRALDAHFSDYEFWMPNAGDLLVVAAHNGKVPAPDARAFDSPRLRADLERFHIRNLDDLLLHRVGGRAALRPYFTAFPVPANSDFYPVLDLNAARARFLHRAADEEVPRLLEAGFPLLDLFDRPRARPSDPARLSPGSRPWLARSGYALQARAAGSYMRGGRLADLEAIPPAAAGDLLLLRSALVDCAVRLPGPALRRLSTYLAWLVNPHLPKAEREGIWRALEGSPCRARLSDMERQWLRLHAAVAAEAGPDIVQASGLILEGDAAASPDLMAYALATHMTGLLLTGRGPEAMTAIVRHGSTLGDAPSWQPVFRLLVGQARN
jgi:predicted membrane-bound spermidine synthase